ncbi:hypothetical protein PSPO01_11932 [Paraphaeosphaeria sporulosa]
MRARASGFVLLFPRKLFVPEILVRRDAVDALGLGNESGCEGRVAQNYEVQQWYLGTHSVQMQTHEYMRQARFTPKFRPLGLLPLHNKLILIERSVSDREFGSAHTCADRHVGANMVLRPVGCPSATSFSLAPLQRSALRTSSPEARAARTCILFPPCHRE